MVRGGGARGDFYRGKSLIPAKLLKPQKLGKFAVKPFQAPSYFKDEDNREAFKESLNGVTMKA